MRVVSSVSHYQYWVCAPFTRHTAAHLHHINTTRLSTVTCRMFSHSSWRSICSWSSFTESGCRRRTTWWRMPDAGNTRSCIIMLENGVVLANEGQDVRSQYFIVVPDCILITNNEMQLCAISMGYSRPNQYATPAVCHPAYGSDVSIPLPCAAPNTLFCKVGNVTFH